MVSPQAFDVPFHNLTATKAARYEAPPGVENGESGGVSFLLNAATYDSIYHAKASDGFKIALSHHMDLPIVSQTGTVKSLGNDHIHTVTLRPYSIPYRIIQYSWIQTLVFTPPHTQ